MFTSWVLVVYMSVGSVNTGLTATTGGPFSVQGYPTREACVADSENFGKMPHYDKSFCVGSSLPPLVAAAPVCDAASKPVAAGSAKSVSAAKK